MSNANPSFTLECTDELGIFRAVIWDYSGEYRFIAHIAEGPFSTMRAWLSERGFHA